MGLRQLLHCFTVFGGFTFCLISPFFALGNIPDPTSFSYEYQVSVVDETGMPLPGVSIFTDDFSVTASTDLDGKALLTEVKYNQELNFTFIGYLTQKIPFHEIRRKNGRIRMLPETKELDEIVVIGRRDDRPEDVPYTTEQVTKEDIALTESQTTADALQQHAGIFVQKSQMGGGSPIMRGFEANRVLLVVDGVRMNNAIYRSGHLQNAITIDNGMLERMEVTFGPGALLYGSDAMGGVVHFRSKEPKLNFEKMPGSSRSISNYYSRFASANEEKSIHADINFGKTNWASLTSFTFTDYGHLRSGNNRPQGYEHFGRQLHLVRRVDGNDQIVGNVVSRADSTLSDNSNVQFGTAYSQMDFAQKVKYQPHEKLYHLFNFQFSSTSDVPRYDALIELRKPSDPKSLKWAEWFYGPQKRLLASWKTRSDNKTGWYDRATFIGSFQTMEEDRLKRRYKNPLRTFNLEEVQVYSLTADFDKNLDSLGRQQVIYGAELNYNNVNSSSGNVDVSDERLFLNELTRYPSEANRVSFGAVYGNYRWSSKDSTLTANAGLRYTINHMYSKFGKDSIIIWPAKYTEEGISTVNQDLTWAGGLTYTSKRNFQVRALISKAFRAPNLDDFSKIRENNGKVSIPNIDLRPETSINYELSIGQQFGQIVNGQGTAARVSATGYYTSVSNFIVRRNATLPDGGRQLVMGLDTLETVGNFNAATGYIYGGNISAQLNMGSRLKFQSSINFIRGKESFYNDSNPLNVIDTLVPASHIPPTHGSTSLTYTGKKWRVSASANYFGRKPLSAYGIVNMEYNVDGELVIDREGGSDNLEYSYTTNGFIFEDYTNDKGQPDIRPACNHPGPEDECDFEYVGTLAYTLLNLYSSYQLTENLTLGLSVENIMDVHYRPFSSGVSGAGRNFILSLRAGFGK